ncbi:MAG: putative DNA-binding domain-containing protein [Deltaproteobacteria bacterium]|nr:putative DNA-binding domain-containing protein [Deltaproteobacteria bacterium]
MRAECELLTLQRRFMTVLREPIFDESRARSELPRRRGSVSARFVETAGDLLTPSVALRPVERLELYHRQYWYRLLDSIAEDFPALRWVLGDDAFWGLIEAYLEAKAPASFTLRHLGAALADFVAARPELVAHPAHTHDLARLEYALCAAFEAADREPLRPEELTSGEVALQPHLRLLALTTPADTLWRRAGGRRARGRLGPPAAKPVRFVAVFRRCLDLHVERIPRAAFAILSALDDTRSLDLAMHRVASAPGLLRRADAELVGRWFACWSARGWFCRTSAGPGPQ